MRSSWAMLPAGPHQAAQQNGAVLRKTRASLMLVFSAADKQNKARAASAPAQECPARRSLPGGSRSMPRIAWPRFREEVLALYALPLRARNSWYKVRQVLDLVGGLGVKTTAELTPPLVARFVSINPDWAPATVKG